MLSPPVVPDPEEEPPLSVPLPDVVPVLPDSVSVFVLFSSVFPVSVLGVVDDDELLEEDELEELLLEDELDELPEPEDGVDGVVCAGVSCTPVSVFAPQTLKNA